MADDIGCSRHAIHIGNPSARDILGLRLVGDEHIEVCQQRLGQRVRRSRVENHLTSRPLSHLCSMLDGFHGRFLLHQQDVAILYGSLRLVNIFGQQVCIGARSHGDGVLAMRIDEDECHPRGVLLVHHHMLRADALGLVLVYGTDAKGVIAHLGHEVDLTA